MQKVTLVMERKPVRVYELTSREVTIGRAEGLHIRIDNVSVSRHQARMRLDDHGAWTVEDLGSANGTFLNGQRITTAQTLNPGDEISFGKFSVFFDREITEPLLERIAASKNGLEQPAGTFLLRADEMEDLQRSVALKRKAHLRWEARGRQGIHPLDNEPTAVLVGRSRRCDLRVPAGPRHHVLITRTHGGYTVRNLSHWYRMRVNGQRCADAALNSGDAVEIGGLRLTFLAEMS
jgi:FHA domain